MRKTRYVMFPDYVTSKHDGDCHFIAAGTLIHLYNIKDFNWDTDLIIQASQAHTYRPQVGDIRLYPNRNGNYKLPKPLTQEGIK